MKSSFEDKIVDFNVFLDPPGQSVRHQSVMLYRNESVVKMSSFFVKTKTPDFAWLSDILLNQKWSDKMIEIYRNRKKWPVKLI